MQPPGWKKQALNLTSAIRHQHFFTGVRHPLSAANPSDMPASKGVQTPEDPYPTSEIQNPTSNIRNPQALLMSQK